VQQQNGLVHLRQVHPLKEPICENLCNLWENIQQESSVYSVNSVGEHKEECNLWENILQEGSVYSVNSVGEHTARRVQSVGEQT